MLKPYHLRILKKALRDKVSPRALEAISAANIAQDNLHGQFGHDEYHFDNNAFEASYAYIEENRALIKPALEKNDVTTAWAAFGRLTHTAHDFYAHSNYIRLWFEQFDEGNAPSVAEVDHANPTFLQHPDLHSGKLYYPLELLYFVPGLKKYVLPYLPRDSHAWMNLDTPEQGPLFGYAIAAAIKCTNDEWAKSTAIFSTDLLEKFTDL